MDFKGKVALVTGAAHGIGMATVQQLLQNGLKGVSMCDMNSENGEAAALSFTKEYGKDRIIFIKTDVTKEKDLEEAFKKTKETFGTIDIVINNAGIVGEDRWQAEIDVNVKGVVKGTQLALDYMGKHKGGNGGTVVNIASVAGLGLRTACPVYDGTKFFVVGYSLSISFPLLDNRHGVRILCMCPGATDTPILTGILDTFETLDVGREVITSQYITQQPDEVAQGIVHILREGATGSVWVCSNSRPVYQVEFPSLLKE